MQIRIPKEDSYFIKGTMFAGPFHDSGEAFEIVNVDEKNDIFQQGNHLYGENSVSHSKSDVAITINSLLASPDSRPASAPLWNHGATTLTLLMLSSKTASTSNTFPELVSGGSAVADNFSKNASIEEVMKRGVVGDTQYQLSGSTGKSTKFPREASFLCTVYRYRVNYLANGSVNPNYVSVRTERFTSIKKQIDSIDHMRSLISVMGPGDFSPTTVGSWSSTVKFTARHPFTANVDKAVKWYRKFSNENSFGVTALPEAQSYGDLVQAACENVNPNTINALEFIADLRNVKSLIPKLKKLKELRTHASNYLGLEYGILPTIDDLKVIWKSFQTKYFYDRNGYQRASSYDDASVNDTTVVDGVEVSTTTTLNRRVHLAIDTGDTGLDALTERMRKIGILPSLTNMWDLVPLSFVLDWFIDVGSVLERIDTHHQLINLDVKYCITSQKVMSLSSLTSVKDGLFVEMTSSSYKRTVGTSVPQPRIFKENRVTAQNHWIEGTALILARKPK